MLDHTHCFFHARLCYMRRSTSACLELWTLRFFFPFTCANIPMKQNPWSNDIRRSFVVSCAFHCLGFVLSHPIISLVILSPDVSLSASRLSGAFVIGASLRFFARDVAQASLFGLIPAKPRRNKEPRFFAPLHIVFAVLQTLLQHPGSEV